MQLVCGVGGAFLTLSDDPLLAGHRLCYLLVHSSSSSPSPIPSFLPLLPISYPFLPLRISLLFPFSSVFIHPFHPPPLPPIPPPCPFSTSHMTSLNTTYPRLMVGFSGYCTSCRRHPGKGARAGGSSSSHSHSRGSTPALPQPQQGLNTCSTSATTGAQHLSSSHLHHIPSLGFFFSVYFISS